jgi:hypothetical protein
MITFEHDAVGNLLTATDSLTKKGTGHPLKANALIWLLHDSRSWRLVRHVEMP